VASLIETIYPGVRTGNHASSYFAERTILSSLNSEVDSINKELLRQFPVLRLQQALIVRLVLRVNWWRVL